MEKEKLVKYPAQDMTIGELTIISKSLNYYYTVSDGVLYSINNK